jgi:hypothetical protein
MWAAHTISRRRKNIMNIKEVITLIDERIDTLNTKCISATKHNPDYYKSLKELRLTSFIKRLMLRIYPNDEDIVGQGDCETIISLCVTKEVTTIEVKEGDNVLDLLDRYKDVKDVYNKIKKACGNKGLTIKGSNIVKI